MNNRKLARKSSFLAPALAPALGLLLIVALAAQACGGVPAPSDITIVTEDGFRLAATEYGKGDNGVILAHDSDGSRADWSEFASELASRGMRVVAVTFRGFPGSDGVRDPQVMDRDLVGAARYLQKEKGVTKIAYVGAGMGGTIAFKAAANPDLQPAVLEVVSPLTRYQTLDATRSTIQLFMPKMVVESDGNKDALNAVQDLFKTLPEPKRFEEVPGTTKGIAMINDPSNERLRTEMVDYLKKGFE